MRREETLKEMEEHGCLGRRGEDGQNEKEEEAVKNKQGPVESMGGGWGCSAPRCCHASESIQAVQSCLVTSMVG